MTVIVSGILTLSPQSTGLYTWHVEELGFGKGRLSLAMDLHGGLHAVFARGSPFFDLVYELNASGSWSQQVVDAKSNYASVAVNVSGSPRIAYYRPDDRTVRYAYPLGAGFVNETVETVEWMLTGGTSLALDAGGRPHLAYWVVLFIGTASMHYAVRSDSGWVVETVADANRVNSEEVPSLALDNNGNPYIAAVYPASQFLAYFRRNGTSWTYEYVDRWNFSTCCEMPSLKLDSMNRPHIAYYNMTGQALRYSHYDPGLGSWITANIYSETGTVASSSRVSLALDHADLPRISYYENDLNQLRYFSFDGTAWTEEVPDSTIYAGWDNSLVLDALDAPHILYWWNDGFNSRMKHAWQTWDDSIPPSSSVESIHPYLHKSQPIRVNSIATDRGSGVANVTLWYRHSPDNVTWGTWTQLGTILSPPWTWLFPVPDGEGYYEFYSTAVDNVGNAEPPPPTADAIAGYDVTPPVSTALPISPYWHATQSLTVNATATDNLSGVAGVTLFYSYAPLSNASWSPWTLLETKTVGPLFWQFLCPDGEGNYRFHTIASDMAGNIEGGKTSAEAIAGYRMPPDYAPVNPSPPSAFIGLSLPLRLSVQIKNDGGFTNATATLAFYNESSRLLPFASIQVPPIENGSTSIPFTATWMSPATPCSCRVVAEVDYYNNLSESNGTNNYHVWTISVVRGPITSLVVGTPDYTSTATYIRSSTPLDFSVLDQSGLGIRNTTYRIDGGDWVNYTATGTFSLAGDGQHMVEWYSIDYAGNVESVNSQTLNVDDTPPATSILVCTPRHQAAELYITSSTAINLTSTDGGAAPVGLARIEYRVDGGGWLPYVSNIILAGANGPRMIEYRSIDLLGNTEEARNITVILDNTPPATTISPATAQVESGTYFTLGATDSGSGVNYTEYMLDGGTWTRYTASFTLSEGDHNITYRSVDNLGNPENEKHLDVTVHGPSVPPPPPPSAEVNYKPLIAVVFTIILAVAGLWSSKRRPWKDGMAAAKAFMITSLPFVLAEAGTGLVSFLTGELSIPPAAEVGMAVDLTIFVAGILLAVFRGTRTLGSQASEQQLSSDEES